MNKSNSRNYFEKIFRIASLENISIGIVTHVLPDKLEFFEFLSDHVKVEFIIPKPNSINKEVFKKMVRTHEIIPATRDEINKGKILKDLFLSFDRKFILVDTGGYFSSSMKILEYYFKKNLLLGVVEDTENGHIRYSRIKDLSIPVFSVCQVPISLNKYSLPKRNLTGDVLSFV